MDFAKTLFEHGHISAEQLVAIRQYKLQHFSSTVEAIQNLKSLPHEALPAYFRLYFNVQHLNDITFQNIDKRCANLIPPDLAIHLRAFCIGGYKHRLLIAMEDPSDLSKRRQLEFFLAKKIVPIAATQQQIDLFLQKNYNYELTRTEERDESNQSLAAEASSLQTQTSEENIESLATKISVSNENSEASQTELENIPPLKKPELDFKELAFQVNSSFIRFGFCKNRVQALEALNAKISPSAVAVEMDETKFIIKIASDSDVHIEYMHLTEQQENRVVQVLLPGLKRILKLP